MAGIDLGVRVGNIAQPWRSGRRDVCVVGEPFMVVTSTLAPQWSLDRRPDGAEAELQPQEGGATLVADKPGSWRLRCSNDGQSEFRDLIALEPRTLCWVPAAPPLAGGCVLVDIGGRQLQAPDETARKLGGLRGLVNEPNFDAAPLERAEARDNSAGMSEVLNAMRLSLAAFGL